LNYVFEIDSGVFMSKKVTIGNVCFLLDKKNQKILLLKRNKDPFRGMYAGVGGKTEFDEGVGASCIREVKEETGLDVWSIKLRGVIKTIFEEHDSSWILFVYTTDDFSGEMTTCNEGELEWVDIRDVYSKDLIGFLRKILPDILEKENLIDGTICIDTNGDVVSISCF
jgi:8-oxo-dGTP diphosphatase